MHSLTSDLVRYALEYLNSHNTMVLSTSGEGGPWATPVFYANEGFTLFFLSSPRSRHARNIASNERVAVAITEDYRDWRDIKGIQIQGVARKLSAPEYFKALQVYNSKFPFIKSFMTDTAGMFQIAGKLVSVRMYQVAIEKLYVVDNARGFGERKEVQLRGE